MLQSKLSAVIATILVVVSMPFALVLSNARWLTLDQGFYLSGFAEQGVQETTGMTAAELSTASSQIIDYLQGGPPVSLVVAKEWGREPLFSPKEASHMVDVQQLVAQVYTAQAASAFILALGFALALLGPARDRFRNLVRRLLAGAALTLAILGALLAAALLDFQSLFVTFHLLSFDNLGWILDPRTDYLIRLFPAGFWYDAALTLVGRTIAEGTLLAVTGGGYLRITARGAVAGRRSSPKTSAMPAD